MVHAYTTNLILILFIIKVILFILHKTQITKFYISIDIQLISFNFHVWSQLVSFDKIRIT